MATEPTRRLPQYTVGEVLALLRAKQPVKLTNGVQKLDRILNRERTARRIVGEGSARTILLQLVAEASATHGRNSWDIHRMTLAEFCPLVEQASQPLTKLRGATSNTQTDTSPGEQAREKCTSLDDYEEAILRALSKAKPRRLTHSQLAAQSRVSEKTIRSRLPQLLGSNLVSYPAGKKQGLTILPGGETLLATLSKFATK